MYCPNCGKEIPNESNFCPECGVKIEVSHDGNSIFRKKKLLTGICIVITLIVIIVLAKTLITPTININKYVTINYDGYDLRGTATVKFDENKLNVDYGQEIARQMQKKSGNDMYGVNQFGIMKDGAYSYTPFVEAFVNGCIDWNLSSEDNLSNGDVVILTWKCDDNKALKEFGIKLKHLDTRYIVKGLKKSQI